MTLRLGTAGRPLVIALACAVTLGLAGCGNQHTGAGYANGGSGVAYAAEPLAKDEIMRAMTVAARKAGSAHVAMTMSGAASLTAKGDVSYGKGKPAMAMTMSMPGMARGRIDMRSVGGLFYVQIPGVTPPGKFIAFDPDDKNSPLARSFAGTTEQMNPMSNITAVSSSVRSADRVGKQTMHGVEVEHYKVTVDTTRIVKQLGARAARQAGMPAKLIYDLWLDAKHQLHRMTFELSGLSFEANMSRWGSPSR
jgi:hypothetical protein